MSRILKKLSLLSMLFMAIWYGFVYAETPDSFSIEVTSSVKVGESTDFTVIAVKDGDWLKEFTGTILFSIYDSDDNYVDQDFVETPGNGWYDFEETDQGKKTFSKGLTFSKAGTYTIVIDSIYPEGIIGKAVITVEGGTGNTSFEPIEITYPSDGSTETNPYVSVMGSCEKLKNSPVVVYLNDKIVNSGYTDIQGGFNLAAQELLSGDNTIQVKILDINGIVLGESANITVKYKTIEDGVFSGIEILPGRQGKQGDKFTFNVYADDTVNIAQIKFSDGSEYTMDRVRPGLFTKDLVVTFSGNIDISVKLIENSDIKEYEKVDSIMIQESNAIVNIKFTATGIDGSQVIVSWDTIGLIEKFKINYGTGKDSLNNSETVSSSTILINNLQNDTSYFFQLIPMDSESHNSGDPTEILEYHTSTSPCIVKGIKVRKEQIGDNYYLVRDPVDNVSSYEVYRSDWADMTDARLVGNLTGTRFQYLFDKDAKQEEFAYYQVQAICKDGTAVIVDKAQKVQVGPVENTLLILIISIFVYSLYRLHKLSDRDI